MKFIVDAQLPAQVAQVLQLLGFDAIHTDDLPDKERTTDAQIRRVAALENRIVVTKDADFLTSYLVTKQPRQLLLITTGNIKNQELLGLFRARLPTIVELFERYNFLEMNRDFLVGRD